MAGWQGGRVAGRQFDGKVSVGLVDRIVGVAGRPGGRIAGWRFCMVHGEQGKGLLEGQDNS